MPEQSLGPLTFRQRIFWTFAMAVVIFGVITVIMATWPSGACGCGG